MDEVVVVIRDNLTLGTPLYKGHFFGEVRIPISKLDKGEEYEDWVSLNKRRGSTGEVSGSILLRLCLQVLSIEICTQEALSRMRFRSRMRTATRPPATTSG